MKILQKISSLFNWTGSGGFGWATMPFGRRIAVILLVFICFIGAHSAHEFGKSYAFLVNTTESLPNWAFIVEKKSAIEREDIVFFIPPKTALLVSYFDDDLPAFGKKAFGLPGDKIDHRDGRVFVNDKPIASTKPYTKTGLKLELGPQGTVPSGCFFLATEHPDGFDSRYSDIGFVCRRQILGVGRAIL